MGVKENIIRLRKLTGVTQEELGKSAFYLRVDDFAPFVHLIRAFRAFHAVRAPRSVPFGTRQGRKKAAPTHGDGSPLDRSLRGPDFLAQF